MSTDRAQQVLAESGMTQEEVEAHIAAAMEEHIAPLSIAELQGHLAAGTTVPDNVAEYAMELGAPVDPRQLSIESIAESRQAMTGEELQRVFYLSEEGQNYVREQFNDPDFVAEVRAKYIENALSEQRPDDPRYWADTVLDDAERQQRAEQIADNAIQSAQQQLEHGMLPETLSSHYLPDVVPMPTAEEFTAMGIDPERVTDNFAEKSRANATLAELQMSIWLAQRTGEMNPQVEAMIAHMRSEPEAYDITQAQSQLLASGEREELLSFLMENAQPGRLQRSADGVVSEVPRAPQAVTTPDGKQHESPIRAVEEDLLSGVTEPQDVSQAATVASVTPPINKEKERGYQPAVG
jgi:hypothetical protein